MSLGPLSTSRRCASWHGSIFRQQGVPFFALSIPGVWYYLNLTHAMIWFQEQSLREVSEICFGIYRENMALSPALLLKGLGHNKCLSKNFVKTAGTANPFSSKGHVKNTSSLPHHSEWPLPQA